MDIFQFWNVYRTVRKKDFVFLARVRLAVSIFQFRIVYHTVAQERDIVALAVVRVCFPVDIFAVLECISYSTQEGFRVSR